MTVDPKPTEDQIATAIGRLLGIDVRGLFSLGAELTGEYRIPKVCEYNGVLKDREWYFDADDCRIYYHTSGNIHSPKWIVRPKTAPQPPTYVPWTAETVPYPCIVCWTKLSRNTRFGITSFNSRGVRIVGMPSSTTDEQVEKSGSMLETDHVNCITHEISYEQLVKEFVTRDGLPCGTLQK